MRSGIDVVHEPGLRPDRGPHAERPVLPAHEHFPVIVDDRFIQGGKLRSAACMKEDGVPSEPLGHPRDRGLRAMLGPCDLPMRRAGSESRRDGDEKRGTFQVVRRGERLPRTTSLAITATEARDASDAARLSIPTVSLEASSGSSMRDAFGPGAEGWEAGGRAHRFYGQNGPMHAGPQRKTEAARK